LPAAVAGPRHLRLRSQKISRRRVHMYVGRSGGNLLAYRLAEFLMMVSSQASTGGAIGSAPNCW
jgi:hypothetical protein